MAQLFTNNAISTILTGIASSALSVQVAAGDGAKFPTPAGGDFFLVTLFQKVDGVEVNHEIVKCTARAADVLTVVRAQEGTTARAFGNGDLIELRLTAGAVLPVNNGALTGPLNEAAAVSLASASSVAIGAAGANTITITGAAPITSFDTVGAGAVRRTTFAGILTLTNNAVSLKLLTGANITTAAGDWAEWLSLGAGNWQMTSYTRANGDALKPISSAAQAALDAKVDTTAVAGLVTDQLTPYLALIYAGL
jgi:hypothetical protein